MKNYFPHDHYARSDKKIINLIRLKGLAGYGLYWCLVEMLYEEGGWLKLSFLESISYDLRIDLRTIESLIKDYDLFFIDEKEGRFSSNAVLSRLNLINEKSSKAAKSAQKRWEAARKNANAMRTHSESDANAMRNECERNALKENKIKETKVNENKENQNIKPSDEGAREGEIIKVIGKVIEGLETDPLDDKNKASQTGGAREIFNQARKQFPGTKRAEATEWENFEKKHSKDPEFRNLPDTMLAAIEAQVSHRNALKAANARFIPEWPHFATWINQRRWEEELPEAPAKVIPITHQSQMSSRLDLANRVSQSFQYDENGKMIS